jgi:hypothetical protein
MLINLIKNYIYTYFTVLMLDLLYERKNYIYIHIDILISVMQFHPAKTFL